MITLIVIIAIIVIWCTAFSLGRSFKIDEYEDKISILFNSQIEEFDKLRKENMDIRFSVQEKVEERLKYLKICNTSPNLWISDITAPGDYRDKELKKFDITDDEITRAFKNLYNNEEKKLQEERFKNMLIINMPVTNEEINKYLKDNNLKME